MDDLVAFVKARLDEAAAAAKAAADVGRMHWSAQFGVVVDAGDPGWAVTTDTLDEIAGHIALYDPARALGEVAAKRRRLALYLGAGEALAAALREAPPLDGPAVAHSYVRERINVNQASGRFAAFEMSVRLDAVAWCGHPDYRAEWKP